MEFLRNLFNSAILLVKKGVNALAGVFGCKVFTIEEAREELASAVKDGLNEFAQTQKEAREMWKGAFPEASDEEVQEVIDSLRKTSPEASKYDFLLLVTHAIDAVITERANAATEDLKAATEKVQAETEELLKELDDEAEENEETTSEETEEVVTVSEETVKEELEAVSETLNVNDYVIKTEVMDAEQSKREALDPHVGLLDCNDKEMLPIDIRNGQTKAIRQLLKRIERGLSTKRVNNLSDSLYSRVPYRNGNTDVFRNWLSDTFQKLDDVTAYIKENNILRG